MTSTFYPPEMNENGNPVFNFPPFRPPPPGVTIIPFRDFKPAGIQRPPLGFADGVELDGLGFPTMKLLNDRSNDDEHITGKKKKKSKKKKAPPKAPARTLSWWQEWEEKEYLRKATPIDQGLPLPVRFQQAEQDFKQARAFMPEVQSVYDHFALFSGLLTRIIQPPQQLRRGRGNAGADDDGSSDEEHPIPPPEGENPPKPTVEDADDDFDIPDTRSFDDRESGASDPEAYIREQEEEEACKSERTNSFFEDPVYAIRVFLSSHFRDKGLIWSSSKLEIGPRVITFFLEFLVRNRLFPEYEPKLRAAVLVAHQATIELPATAKISPLFPELFAIISQETWGTFTSTLDELESTWRINTPSDMHVSPTRSKNGSDSDGISGWLAEHAASNPDPIPEETTGDGWGQGGGGWGETVNAEAGGSWNPEPEADAQDIWNAPNNMKSFMRLWGPVETCLAHTHEPKLIELSTRRIGKMYQPGQFEGSDQVPGLSCGNLHVWKIPEGYYLTPPELHEIPLKRKRGRLPGSGPEQTRIIKVLLDPEVMRILVPDMLLGGSFVKIAPKADVEEAKGLNEWWYAEKLMQTLPSYYAEFSAPFIDNLLPIRP